MAAVTRPDISIIVPMFNESENIVHTLEQIRSAFETRPEQWEVVFVNDGSTDDTAQVAKRLAEAYSNVQVVSYPHNKGRGYALRCGFAAAQGAILVTIDADLSYAPPYILKVIDALKNDPQVHVALGSPYMPGGSTENITPFRLFLSRFGNIILQTLVNREIYTWTGIFRAYRRQVIESIDLESDGKEIHLEILTRVMAVGYKVKEVPAVLTTRRLGKSKFRFMNTILSHLKFVFIERAILFFGAIGGIALLIGFIFGLYITYLRFDGSLNPERPLMVMTVILLLGGVQLLSFGVLAFQISLIRRELYRTQKQILLDQPHPSLPFESDSIDSKG
jgi:glycosyltransferase involved in cell wall biosynthesis